MPISAPWREPCRFPSHAHLLADMFHEGPGNRAAVLPEGRNAAMTLFLSFK